jgi:hypothetical protein
MPEPRAATVKAKFTPAFWKWFGKSKVVDGNGKPLVVYHGTTEDFSVFEIGSIGGIWFTDDRIHAKYFGSVGKYYLSIENPTYIDGDSPVFEAGGAEADAHLYVVLTAAKKNGHDGAILKWEGSGLNYIAFSPEQIKSATGNDGTFDADDPDIRSNPQKYSSKGTSQRQLAGLFKSWQSRHGFHGINLDLGGGKYDLAQEWMDKNNIQCRNLVVDPNRTDAHNKEMLALVAANGGADSVTIANVLNVIDDLESRLHVLKQADDYAKPGAPVIISVYERNKDGTPTVTKADSWQANRKLATYLPEAQAILDDPKILSGKGLIVARGRGGRYA